MSIWESILLAASLCADCLAVSLCSGVTLRSVRWREILGVALAFAVIQSGLLLAGWAFGYLFVGLVEKISHIIAFLLLLYVGGSMLLEGIKGEAEVRDLSSWRNIIIGGVATSIDALALGVAQSMEGADWPAFLPLLVAVFAITALSVVIGLRGGRAIGARLGRWAEIVGGVVLIAIGVSVLV
jgi:putative Mn2+ efflux pump MntP